MRDDQPLTLDHRMKVMPSGMLEITDVKISDSGHYKCNVTLSDGSQQRLSRGAKLKLNFDDGEFSNWRSFKVAQSVKSPFFFYLSFFSFTFFLQNFSSKKFLVRPLNCIEIFLASITKKETTLAIIPISFLIVTLQKWYNDRQ